MLTQYPLKYHGWSDCQPATLWGYFSQLPCCHSLPAPPFFTNVISAFNPFPLLIGPHSQHFPITFWFFYLCILRPSLGMDLVIIGIGPAPFIDPDPAPATADGHLHIYQYTGLFSANAKAIKYAGWKRYVSFLLKILQSSLRPKFRPCPETQCCACLLEEVDTNKPSTFITSPMVRRVVDGSLMEWLVHKLNETPRAPERQRQEGEEGVGAEMLVPIDCQEILMSRAQGSRENPHCAVPSCPGDSCLKP